MFILSSISSSLKFWSVNHNSVNENSELRVFKNIKVLGKISSNLPNDLLRTNVYKTWIMLMNVVDNITVY